MNNLLEEYEFKEWGYTMAITIYPSLKKIRKELVLKNLEYMIENGFLNLSEKQLFIAKCIYKDNMKFRKIAYELGVTETAVRHNYSDMLRILPMKLENCILEDITSMESYTLSTKVVDVREFSVRLVSALNRAKIINMNDLVNTFKNNKLQRTRGVGGKSFELILSVLVDHNLL